MKLNHPVTTLIFDYGGVIVNLDLPACIQNLKNLGFANVEQYLSNFGQKDFFLQFENGQIDTIGFRENIRKNVSQSISDAQIDQAWCSFLCDIPPHRIALLRELRQKYRLLLLSNTNPLHINESTQKALEPYNTALNELFDTCYLSYEMGVTKPSEAIFNALLENENLQAQECLFLDDGLKNIETAQRLGFQTYYVQQGDNFDFLLELYL
jgi:putative hydrolase of the HAD superfamily